MIVIKKLEEDGWKEYRDLRLQALKREPTAFGSSYDEEKDITEEQWRKRTIGNALFALSKDKLIGMIGYFRVNRTKLRHIANIFGFYVSREYRGQGVGKKLIDSVLIQIKKSEDIVKIKLAVNPEQKAAVKLYQSFGFKVVGQLKNELYIKGKFYDELIMEKLL
jgi:RimJ/RimL family protein N-acetyltransferase